ncbi:hypothetical protein [uncultured Sulfitobacter sp.]|uniref:hypothetical protein n=1 Tax=uncultured Sulfitobacter sp. TaxID=191468 RepID=UPI00261256AD|nr:hypothetical protein [uncultured Sulfitobacter sp.]
MGQRQGLGANTMAALLGTLAPFCSCSSIPSMIMLKRVVILPLPAIYLFEKNTEYDH